MAQLNFNEQFYLSQNPDVAAAVSRGQFANAQQHFNLNGRFEGRDPNAFFDTSFYLSQYPDVANARVNPLEHFLNFGAAEGRFANATIDGALDSDNNNFANEFNAQAYLAANQDLASAVGPGRAFETAYEHYVLFGQFESRPGTPSGGPFTNTGTQPGAGPVFTLTPGADLAGPSSASNSGIASDFRLGNGNQTIEAGAGTLGAGDIFLDTSTTDNDRLNVTLTGDSGAFTAQNIETINATFTAGTPILNLTNVTGTKAVNVTGSVAGTVSAVNASSATSPTIGLNNYTNTVTIAPTTLAGTGATAETINVAVSGATFGTTAATQSVIRVDGTAGAGTVETLNIASNGSAANTFGLVAANGAVLGTTNITGSANATVRVDSATITGSTVAAAANTGIVTLDINRDGAGTASTNLTNVTGVEVFAFRDTTAGTDALVATNVVAGSEVQVLSSFAAGGSLSVANAATNTADALRLTLDNAAATTSTTVGGLDVQNVETLNLVSNGNSAAAAGAGNAITLTGDFTTVNVTGDTAVALTLNVDAPASGNQTTTVTAAGLTGTAGFTFTANDTDATNLYTVTGSANADVLTGGVGNDTINGGAGNDIINGGAGANTLTGGAGTDTFQFRVAAVGTDTVTDFAAGAGGDILAIESTGITAALDAGANFVKGGVGTIGQNDSSIAFASNSVIVITDRSFANIADVQAELALEAGSAIEDYAVVFLNSTTGFAELYIDDTTASTTGELQLASFQNITTLSGVSALTANNFADLA